MIWLDPNLALVAQYLFKDDATKASFDDEGYYLTGDTVEVNTTGHYCFVLYICFVCYVFVPVAFMPLAYRRRWNGMGSNGACWFGARLGCSTTRPSNRRGSVEWLLLSLSTIHQSPPRASLCTQTQNML